MTEILGLGLGLQSRRLTSAWDVSREVAQINAFWSVRRSSLLSQYAEAIKTGAPDEIKSVLDAIRYFNSILPIEMRQSTRITADAIRTSVKARLGAVLRKDAGLAASKSDQALLARVKSLYPESDPVSATVVK